MTEYIVRRILLVFPVMLGVSIVVFMSIRLIPGDFVEVYVAQRLSTTAEQKAEIRRELGLDKPGYEQFAIWLSKIVRLDLGTSLMTKQPVAERIKAALPVTLELVVLAVVIGVLIAIPGGVIAAIRQDRWIDYVLRVSTIGFISIPNFVIATLLLILPALWFRYAAPLGYVSPFVDPVKNIQQFIFPALALGIGFSSTLLRMTRSSMLEVLREDYIRTAWAKGLKERAIVIRHALKNAMIPPITIIGSQIATLIAGAVIVETIFTLPGLGSLTIQAIGDRDYPQVQGIVLFLASAVVLINLLVDISYAWFDPRIRYR